MEIVYDEWTGHPKTVLPKLRRSLAQHISTQRSVKVGITSNPSQRASDHRATRPRWGKMVLKYRTDSVSYMNSVEQDLVKDYYDYLTNERGGGGGPDGNSGPYYVYFLIR